MPSRWAPRVTTLAALAVVGVTAAAAPQVSPASQTSPASNSPSTLLGLGTAVPAVRGLYLDAAPSASAEVITPGKAFTIRADITPKRGVRVYAPGNASYTPVTLSIDPEQGVIAGPVKYPKAVEFFFAPLQERVQVFSAGFRLERDVTVMAAATSLALATTPALTIRGKLEYQACDDKVCYLPQSLPLTWTVVIRR